MSWITDNVFEFRPLTPLDDMYRYNNGDWIPDDGEYDIAFITGDKGGVGAPWALYVELPNHKNLLWSYAYYGNWGARVYEHPDANAWHYMTTDGKPYKGYWGRSSHPNVAVHDIATNRVSKAHGCANGHGVHFEIGEKVIEAGLLRIRGTEEVVKFPDIFKCCYCGDIDWRKVEATPREQFWDLYAVKCAERKLREEKDKYIAKYGKLEIEVLECKKQKK